MSTGRSGKVLWKVGLVNLVCSESKSFGSFILWDIPEYDILKVLRSFCLKFLCIFHVLRANVSLILQMCLFFRRFRDKDVLLVFLHVPLESTVQVKVRSVKTSKFVSGRSTKSSCSWEGDGGACLPGCLQI